jgi:hypothetical protein
MGENMEAIFLLLFGAAVFGLCFLADKLFKRLFRSKKQHSTGRSVRLSKRYGSFGALMVTLGVAGLFAWINGGKWIMGASGGLVLVVGIGLIIYYLTFGIYYDDDSFLYHTFGKRGITYEYGDILGQKLYTASGNIVVELHMKDGNTVIVQATMDGSFDFLDEAFAGWCRQTEHDPEQCDFHDPSNSLWFPDMEEL